VVALVVALPLMISAHHFANRFARVCAARRQIRRPSGSLVKVIM